MAKISALPLLAQRFGNEKIPVVTGPVGARFTAQMSLSEIGDAANLLAFSSTDPTLEPFSTALLPTQSAVAAFVAAELAEALAGVATAEATNLEALAGVVTSKLISPRRLFAMSAPVALVDAASIALDGNTGINFAVTIAGDRLLESPSNMKPGQSGLVVVTQGAGGNRKLTFGPAWRFLGGKATLSTNAGAVDVITYFALSADVMLCSLGGDFKAPTA